MVLGPDGSNIDYGVKQALMYQPYGTVSNVDEGGANVMFSDRFFMENFTVLLLISGCTT